METKEKVNKTSICVNGSRGFNFPECMDRHMRIRIPNGQEKNYRLVLGGAKGADTLAKEWAIKNGVEYIEIKPNWSKFGKKAGILRNIDMIDMSQELISFWDDSSRGTKHAMDYAKERGIPVRVIHYLDPGYRD